jgi:hypothetical protein
MGQLGDDQQQGRVGAGTIEVNDHIKDLQLIHLMQMAKTKRGEREREREREREERESANA